MTREEWLVERRKYITGTQIASLFGLNPYKSINRIMKEKAAGIELIDNVYMRRGRILEPAIIQAVNELTEFEATVPQHKFFINSSIAVTLDGWIQRGLDYGPIECKTINDIDKFFNTKLKYVYLLQLICQMLCVTCTTGKLAFFNLKEGIEFFFIELMGDPDLSGFEKIIIAEASRALEEKEAYTKNIENCKFVQQELDNLELYVFKERIV